ncbi:sensor histidine kinase [Piscinibacter sp.]|uniref:sensor histidine kinase n=1 Tax=Piscinibacter sp. TaxID=1903157 RepID=UPI002C935C1D|nr:ATP-binding protein [Albitalea sp.]HUG25373.1 ATP-binding protein [Albitalea sp.]
MNEPSLTAGSARHVRFHMSSLHRVSFRQLLLVAFLLVAALLAAASLHGLFTLERLIGQSREGAERSVTATAAVQNLAERSVAMERAARQYLVLDDSALRRRYAAASHDAIGALEQLQGNDLPASAANDWRSTADAIAALLDGPRATAPERDQALTDAFRELGVINEDVAQRVRRAMQSRNESLRDELEAGRLMLARQLLAAIGIALLMALAFGVLLSRPLKRVEEAIDRLGANRLDDRIEIDGPADVRQLGRSLDALRLRLAQQDAEKARFLRHVSHDLKTPLAALREGVALLEDGVTGALSTSQREVARILRHNTQALQVRIEDLLRFNAAVFEAQRLQRQPVELRSLIERVVDDQRLQAQARQLQVHVSGEPVSAELDPDKMATALANLLSNAIRFSALGGTIRFGVSQHADSVRIEIADSGPGVAVADRGRVFEPFYRGERQPQDAARGSGIGLSIVHEYVTAHGGRIELLPDEPGACFRIEVPHASSP